MEYYNIQKDVDTGNYYLDMKVVINLEMGSEYNFVPG